MKLKNLKFILISSILFFACNSDTKSDSSSNLNAEKTTTSKTNENACTYSIDKEDIGFKWTAFKTTAKIGVSGTFDDIMIENDKKNAPSIPDLLFNTYFYLNLISINSNNESRDQKLIKFFFNNLSNSDNIKGTIGKADGNKIAFDLSINGIEKAVFLDYEINDNIMNIVGDINLLEWKTEKALDALHNACEEKHTGEDGVSKTWADIHIEITVPIIEDCK